MPPKPEEGLRPWHKAAGDKLSRSEAQDFCRTVLESDTYRNRIKERAERGILPPMVEVMLWNYAYGKPPEELKLSVAEKDLSDLTIEQLQERAKRAFDALQEARAADEALEMVATIQ